MKENKTHLKIWYCTKNNTNSVSITVLLNDISEFKKYLHKFINFHLHTHTHTHTHTQRERERERERELIYQIVEVDITII